MNNHDFKTGDMVAVKLGLEFDDGFYLNGGGTAAKENMFQIAPPLTIEARRVLDQAVAYDDWMQRHEPNASSSLLVAIREYRATVIDPVKTLVDAILHDCHSIPDDIVSLARSMKECRQ